MRGRLVLTVQLLIAPLARVEHQHAPQAQSDDDETSLYDPRTVDPHPTPRTPSEQEEP